MIEMLYKQLELTPDNDDLRFLKASLEKRPGRSVHFMFVPSDDDLAICYIRGEVRDHENDCVGYRFFYDEAKIPHIHDELIRFGFAKLFFDGQREVVESQLERLRRQLFKEEGP
jgi:hypothetical protein